MVLVGIVGRLLVHLILVVDMAFGWVVRVASWVVNLLGLLTTVGTSSNVHIYVVRELVVDILFS